MKNHQLTTPKDSAYIEWLQMEVRGLIMRDLPDTSGFQIDDTVSLTTSDGDTYEGCYIYQVSSDKIFVGVS